MHYQKGWDDTKMARKSRKNINISTSCENPERVFNAALYVRLSREETEGTKNENSFKNQKAFLMDYISDKPDINLYKIYEDDGATGTNFNRPGFSEMMYDVSNEKIDCIIVKDLSRFGREHIEMGKYLDYLFPTIGLRFIAVNDGYDSYDKIKNNDMIVPFKNIINSIYSKDISMKVISSLSIKQRNGESLATYPSYGYNMDENRRFVIDTYAAKIVKRVFDMYVNQGMSTLQISRAFNSEKIDTPSVYRYRQGFIKNEKLLGRKIWNPLLIGTILKNQQYLGHMVSGKTKSMFLEMGEKKQKSVDKSSWIIVKNTHEPIIDKELFEKAQEKLSLHKCVKNNTKRENVFVGKVFCGNCSERLIYQKNNKHRYLCCSLHAIEPGKCSFTSIDYNVVSDVVFHSIKNYIISCLDTKAVDDKIKNSYEVRKRKVMFESKIRICSLEINKLKKRRFELFNDYINEIISADEFEYARETFTNELCYAEDKFKALNGEYSKFMKLLEPQSWVDTFKKYRSSRKLTKEMVDYFVDRIDVFENNQIKIKWRFSDKDFGGDLSCTIN